MDYANLGQGVGSFLGAAGTLIGANANVKAARQNEQFARQSAEFDILRGTLVQQDIDRRAREALAGQKVAYAGQNVDLASETVQVVREETFMEAQRMKNEAELDAALSAWGKREQARLNVESAKDARRGARISAAGQVIGGAGSLMGAF